MLSGVCLDRRTGVSLSLCMGVELGPATDVTLGLGMGAGLRLSQV